MSTRRSAKKSLSLDETGRAFDAYTRLQLANRVTRRRESLLLFIIDYVLGTVRGETFNLIARRPDVPLDDSVIELLEQQKRLRNNDAYMRVQTSSLAKNMTIDSLNKLLRYYDEVYRDIVDMIDLTEKTGIALKAPVDETVIVLLEALYVLLSVGSAKDKCGQRTTKQ